MSVKEESKKLNEEVVVDENKTTETEMVIKEEEVKTSKAKAVAKTVAKTALKIAGVGAVGFIGFLLGAKCGSKKNEDNYDDQEVIEAEIIDEE